MKAITIKQPWATLIALGLKQFETRSWATKHRGPLAIHAGKNLDFLAYCEFSKVLELHGYKSMKDLPTGAVIATANLIECHKVIKQDRCEEAETDKGAIITGKEFLYGFYEEGRCAWELTNVQVLPKPVPAKGQLSLWNWDEKVTGVKFEVVYEVPPMRGLFRTEVNANSARDAEEKIRNNPEIANYRIKTVTEILGEEEK